MCVCWGGRIRENAKQVNAGSSEDFIGEYGQNAFSLYLYYFISPHSFIEDLSTLFQFFLAMTLLELCLAKKKIKKK